MDGNIVKLVFQAAASGFDRVTSALSGVAAKAKGVSGACAAIISSVSGSGNALGQAAQHVSQFIGAFTQLGPIGAAIAGVQIIIDKVSQYFIDRANAMAEAAQRAGERIRERLARRIEKDMAEVSSALAAATTEAQRQAKALETMANAYLKVASAKDAAAKAGDDAAASGLSLERSQKMAEAKTPEEKARVGAEYDVRIAREGIAATQRQQDAAVSAAERDADEKARRARRAGKDEKMAERALRKAKEEYELYDNAGAEESDVAWFKSKMEAAQSAYDSAVNDRTSKQADSEAAEEALKAAISARETAMNNARKTLVEAESAERDLHKAQKEATAATMAKTKAELAAVQAENRKAAADRQRAALAERRVRLDAEGGVATQLAAGSASRFAQHFDLWRDPAAAQQAQDAAKQKTVDMQRFRKEVGKYGGKWRIDEAAALMRQGDEAGLQERLAQWRKSGKFNGQTEQMVLAAAAQQNEKAAERSLANIEKNTADLSKKLEDLLKVK